MNNLESYTTSVQNCSACGGDHEEINFTILDEIEGKFTHVGKCPTTNQELYLYFTTEIE